MKVEISAEAERDLLEIEAYVASDKPAAARSLIKALLHQCKSLRSAPERGRIVGASRGIPIRRLVHGSYLIFYSVSTTEVRIYRIRHGAQLPSFLDDTDRTS